MYAHSHAPCENGDKLMANVNGVKVTFLGGVGEIGKNMNVIEYGNDMIIVDCGVSFPKDDCPGIDAIIPDITYIKENIKRLRGIVLTHGHEDHIGAIPYYAHEFKNTPIYGTALTLGLLKRKLDKGGKASNLVRVNAGDTIQLGSFSIEFIKVAHSMAGACALAITTPAGTVFVTGDFKMDNTPIDGKKTNVHRIAQIGAKGVLLMLGESTNVERKGSSTSEKVVGRSLEAIFIENPNKRLVVACFASSNYRVQQVLELAHKYKRKVVLAGKSMKAIVDVASEVGELKIPKGLIVDSVGKLLPSETLVLATGSQGEPLSALNKMSKGEFNKINIGSDDVVVLSSSPIPGNEKSVYDVINDLFRKGANVIYDSMNDIHVSGHAYEEELRLMLSLVHPQYFMPVHGEYRHQFKHAEIAKSLGVHSKNIVIPNIGESFGISQRGIRRHANVTAGDAYVDGVVLEDGKSVVADRLSLAEYGMLIVLCAVDTEMCRIVGDIEIYGRGFNLTDEVEFNIKSATRSCIMGVDFDKVDINDIAKLVKKAIRKLFYKDRHFPIIVPVIVED